MKTRKWLVIDRLIGTLLPYRFRRKIYRRNGMNVADSAVLSYGIHFDNPATITIGENTHINKFTKFYTGDPLTAQIKLGNNIDIGQDVKFVCASHKLGLNPLGPRAGEQIYYGITVEDYCWIGTGAIILPGVTIRQGCVIGAGAVVTKDTEPNCIYAGVPAKKLRRIEDSSDENK